MTSVSEQLDAARFAGRVDLRSFVVPGASFDADVEQHRVSCALMAGANYKVALARSQKNST